MHKSKPSQELSASPFDELYERARQRLVATAKRATPELASAPADPDSTSEARTAEQLLSDRELCRVLREPLVWLLSLAQCLAVGDPLDLAAVQRVRAATFARLSGQPAGFRAADVLTVFALLFGALDPTIVFSAISGALGEGVAAMLSLELPMAVYASTPDTLARRAAVVCTHPHCPLQAQLGR